MAPSVAKVKTTGGMSRFGNRRRGMRRQQQNQSRDEFARYRSDEGGGGSRRWDLSPAYREHFGHQVISDERSYGYNQNPNRYQYYGGYEDYPGPSRMQGFGGGGYRWDREDSGRDWRERNRGYGNQSYRTDWRDMSEYGYGSGRSDMPQRRTWDERNDESYNWGQHSGDDWRRSGQHRGKGPKGYKRLDERIREEINDVLCDDESLDASEIVVSVDNGEVSLSGTVSDRASKRRAEDLVEEVSGVTNVENRIRIGMVTPEEPTSRESHQTANGKRKAFQES